MIRVDVRVTFTLSSLFKVLPVSFMALATSTADTSFWASGAAEATERLAELTAAAAPLIADPRLRPRPTATG